MKLPWSNLAKLVQPSRGDLITVLGAPAVGKSVLTLNWAIQSESPSLIINLDTPNHQQGYRMVAMDSGLEYHQVKAQPLWAADYIDAHLSHVRGIDRVASKDPAKEIHNIIMAEQEYWGEAPALVIVDNIRNVVKGHDYESFADAFKGLHHVAMLDNVCLVVLHHVTRANGDMYKPLPIYAGQFSGEQDSMVMLGMWRSGPTDGVNISVLKQREGPFDPSGNMYSHLNFDHSSYLLSE